MALDMTKLSELGRQYVQAVGEISTGDYRRFKTLWTDDAVWHAEGRNPFSGHHVGYEAVEEWFRSMIGLGMYGEVTEILFDDEHFVFFIHIRGERDGKVLDQIHADAWRVRDGKFCEGSSFRPTKKYGTTSCLEAERPQCRLGIRRVAEPSPRHLVSRSRR